MDLTKAIQHKPAADVDLIPHLRDLWKYLLGKKVFLQTRVPVGDHKNMMLAEVTSHMECVEDAARFILKTLKERRAQTER